MINKVSGGGVQGGGGGATDDHEWRFRAHEVFVLFHLSLPALANHSSLSAKTFVQFVMSPVQ